MIRMTRVRLEDSVIKKLDALVKKQNLSSNLVQKYRKLKITRSDVTRYLIESGLK